MMYMYYLYNMYNLYNLYNMYNLYDLYLNHQLSWWCMTDGMVVGRLIAKLLLAAKINIMQIE